MPSMITVPADARIPTMFPDARPMPGQAGYELSHTPHTSILLRTLGYKVPAAVTQPGNYNWPGDPPFDIQKHTVAHLTENPHAYVLSSMGTGKTKCVLWAYDYLRQTRAVRKMLVVAPLSTLNFTWGREIFQTVPHLRYAVLWHASAEKRRERLALDVDIYVINHDGLKLLWKDIAARKDIDVVCFDELAVYRNKTDRTRIAVELARLKPIVWGMTGAPTPNLPTDVFWQSKVVTPNTTPKWYGRFREDLMLRVSQFKWVPKRDAHEKAISALRPNVRFNLEDVVELPEFVSQRIDVPMGARQAAIYTVMTNACQAMVQDRLITAANAAGIMSKLQQISLGWVYDQKKEVVHLDNEARLRAMLDVVDGAANKVLVLVPFKHALAGISEALARAGFANTPLSGDTNPNERDRIFNQFQNGRDMKVLPAHPQCIAHGVTLTAADTVLWFAPTLSAEIYDQANMRIRRIGQKHKQLFLHLQATVVERKLYSLLQRKIVSQDALLAILEDESWASMNEALT
jgi:helicase-like protein/SNF2 domain-containing protein